SATQRADPGRVLVESLQAESPELRATALRVAGVLGRNDLLPIVLEQLQDDDALVRFHAACAATLLGDETVAPRQALSCVETGRLREAERALRIALRALPLNEALPWVGRLARRPETLRHAVTACGVIGDPEAVPWLLEQMRVPEISRVAGEAFTMITGVDLAYEDLEGEWPEGFQAGPTENPEDEDVAMDPDEDLPWPDPVLVTDWWSSHRERFSPGQRYLVGNRIGREHLQWVLRHGMQRQRAAAALELKLLHPAEPLFETRAPGFAQQQVLGSGI
ncbi:MAG: TIGR02270 family protein, partial [Ectothiorhodospiraceae bacterium]|nr:TIGR02270 family protein [Ectothiorhodospiraceae bacterium]